MKKAFTLSEVLITLGIIGIISAMTVPSVVANHKKLVVETKLKKFYSTINQAVKMSVADNGETKYWNIAPSADSVSMYKKYFAKYLTPRKVEYGGEPDGASVYIYFEDNSVAMIQNQVDWTYCADAPVYDPEGGKINKTCFFFRLWPNLLASEDKPEGWEDETSTFHKVSKNSWLYKNHYNKGVEPIVNDSESFINNDTGELETKNFENVEDLYNAKYPYYYLAKIAQMHDWKLPKGFRSIYAFQKKEDFKY